jgi:hypothetical protein
MFIKKTPKGTINKISKYHNSAFFAWSGWFFSMLGVAVSIWTLAVPVQNIEEKTEQIGSEIVTLQRAMQTNGAKMALRNYFYLLETQRFSDAWNMHTKEKKQNTKDGLQAFERWLKDFIAFENFKITEIKESVSTKVFLVEFDFKKRGLKPVESKWGMYMKWEDDDWKLDYTSVYFENEWKKSKEDACTFYYGFSICT